MSIAGRSNLKVLDLLIQVIPFRVHVIDKDFFLFSAATFYSFFLCDCFSDSVKPSIIDKFFAVVRRCETIGIKIFFMLSAPCSRDGCYTDKQRGVVHTAHDIDIILLFACNGFGDCNSLLRPAA